MQRYRIANGVTYTYIPGKFKKNRISVHFRVPLARDTITETALIPSLLDLECEKYPSLTLLRRRLSYLYGADLYCESGVFDHARTLSAAVEGVEERFIKGAEGLSLERADLLLEMIFSPRIVDGGFPLKSVQSESQKLREKIQASINNKRSFALRKASALYFGDDIRSLPSEGFAEDIDAITPDRLAKVYFDVLSSAVIEVINVGYEENGIGAFFESLFSKLSRKPAAISPPKAVEIKGERTKEYIFDVEQDKLAMIFGAGRLLTEQEQAQFRVASAILGGVPTSRLSMEVREKKSLCYYCAARPGLVSAALTIDSGVERENTLRLKEAVLNEVNKLSVTPPSDEELEATKLYLKNAFASLNNSPDGVSGWYINSLYRYGRPVSPEEELQKAMSVTKEEVSEILSKFRLETTVRVTGEDD